MFNYFLQILSDLHHTIHEPKETDTKQCLSKVKKYGEQLSLRQRSQMSQDVHCQTQGCFDGGNCAKC